MHLSVSVLGAGFFGTTMAHLFIENAPTLLWCRRPEIADEINQEHRNSSYLPDHAIAPELRPASSLARTRSWPSSYSVLYEGRSAEDAYRGTTQRSPGSENEAD
ncbi:MAG: hypothetical protein ABGX04_09160 [Myxococcales bacterium]|nr:hypothetical protein [Myxococcales bacterium]HIK84648.1 hypothetical protein [Myxococcales bacterium]